MSFKGLQILVQVFEVIYKYNQYIVVVVHQSSNLLGLRFPSGYDSGFFPTYVELRSVRILKGTLR